jgi:hypothetical protein
MSGKKNIRIPVSNDEKLITVELKNDIDLLEILSLKFTQSDVYQSGLCSDYGVVVGRVSANNGLGIPNAKISIFVPLNDNDELDPVISSLYPYKSITDKNEDGYRYNLLPKRKQHGGHTPTGTFFDQEDILTGEEYLEVFEKYYNYTVKTNESGDFMIWGVPVGKQTIHIDVDLSDIGCFSLRPYDFIRKGVGEEKFDRYYNFKSSTDIDGLPQIVKFQKDLEVYPFIGNEEMCEIGISRVDFDLTELDIKIEPVSVLLLSTFTDDDSKAIKKNGKIRSKMGYKCNLQTIEGSIESVRFTGGKVYGSDGTLYPELEYFNLPETINENGVSMVVLPMNTDYIYTNEFGEQEITTDKNKGIPTKLISRFRISLNSENQKVSTAKYLLPNVREFNTRVDGKNLGINGIGGETDELLLSSYMFSDVFEDYIKIPDVYSGITTNKIIEGIKSYKRDLILNTNVDTNELIPLDYFYKFTYGKVYTVSSFQGSYYDYNTNKSDSFLGIKEIRPDEESDCAGNTNYFPTNYAFKNKVKFSVIISKLLLFVTFIYNFVFINIGSLVGKLLYDLSRLLYNIYFPWPVNWRPFVRISELLEDVAYGVQSYFSVDVSLKTYPDCEECQQDIYSTNIDRENDIPIAEIKMSLNVWDNSNYTGLFFVWSGETIINNYFRNQTGSTSFISSDVNSDPVLGDPTKSIDYSSLPSLSSQTIFYGDTSIPKYYAIIYSSPSNIDGFKIGESIVNFSGDGDGITYNIGAYSHSLEGKNNDCNDTKMIAKIQVDREKLLRLTGLDTKKFDESADLLTSPDCRKQYFYFKIYERVVPTETEDATFLVEQGCQKYDTFYDEDILYSNLWSTGTTYDVNYNGDFTSGKYVISTTSPGNNYTLLSSIAGKSNTLALPFYKEFSKIGIKRYNRKTMTGKSEIRDGVYTIIPVINGVNNNNLMLTEWYRRKGIGLSLCSGIINYSFIDNWLNGTLYFFKFRKRVRWDDEEKNDLSQRGTKYPRDLVFFNVLDSNFYYRSTPFNPLQQKFIGQKNEKNQIELLHPTTFYDVGVRDEFFYEICSNPELDSTCSVVRDISNTSYQDPANIVEYGVMYRSDISKKTDINDFFNRNDFDGNTDTLDGDFIQLFSINSEVGIEDFDLDSPQYFMYNNEILDPEDISLKNYFTSGGTNYGPLPIDFKFDENGSFMRGCLNYRLGDYSQPVPFYLWDKKGEGFGLYGTESDTQSWDRYHIASMPLQRIFSINDVTSNVSNYVMKDGEEEYLLRPMTITHNNIFIEGDYEDIIERFNYISNSAPNTGSGMASGYTEAEVWLHVTSGTTSSPDSGYTYVVVNKTWTLQTPPYINGTNEIFIYQTAQNYNGNKQVLSTPFLFYFGLRPQNTSLDLLNKFYGPKGAFPPTD